MKTLTIGGVSKEANVNVETIRYYERRGLLTKPMRSPAGYRIYSADAVRRLHFVKRAQELGFSLNEIKELLGLRVRPGSTVIVSLPAVPRMAPAESPSSE